MGRLREITLVVMLQHARVHWNGVRPGPQQRFVAPLTRNADQGRGWHRLSFRLPHTIVCATPVMISPLYDLRIKHRLRRQRRRMWNFSFGPIK